MDWIIANLPIALAIATGILSEALSVIQQLKYPTNSGVGGVISGLLKILKTFGSKSV